MQPNPDCAHIRRPTERRCTPVPDDLSTLRGIVDAYIRDKRTLAAIELQFYANQPSLADVISIAARCKAPSGKRHSHQNRIPPESLAEARRRLLAADLRGATTFDELHNAIAELIDDIWMVGALTIYDIAHRIGAHLTLTLAPARVYLHCGTRRGARALGLGRGRQTLEVHELPREFRRLSAGEIEDCLCIYEAEIAQVVAGRGGARRGG